MGILPTTAITLAAGMLLAAATLIISTKARAAQKKRRAQKDFTTLMTTRAKAAEKLVGEINSTIVTRAQYQMLVEERFPLLRPGWTQP